jgi:enoyl-CoA hydratase/carnithine racemase
MIDSRYGDISVDLEQHVATVEIHRPPHNFFDEHLIANIAEAFEALDREDQCRTIVLASEGKSFCAGADFTKSAEFERDEPESSRAARLYIQAIRLFKTNKPVIAAIQGAAVGGGLGVALTADFRIATPEARFAANFSKLGLHPGFGLSHTLPRLIGLQRASLMFATGRRITGEQAVAWGLADFLVPQERLRDEARSRAR